MKTRLLRWFVLLAAIALSVCCAAAQTQLIVTTAPSNIAGLTSQYGLTLLETIDSEDGVYLVSAPASVSIQQVTAELSTDTRVQAFEQNSIMESSEIEPLSKVTYDLSAIQAALSNTATTTYYDSTVRGTYLNQPAASMIRVPNAHQSFPTGGPIVAIIDTGVDPTHPALANVLVGGYDFTRNQPGTPDERLDLSPSAVGTLAQSSVVPTSQKTQPFVLSQSTVVILDQSTVVILDGSGLPSDFGHGTMVAGLVHLVAPTALIMPLKAFQSNGNANLSDIIRAIYYATDNGATVISMSFDTETASPDLNNAIQYASAHGVICVAAAGNEGQQEMVYPAGFQNVVGVGSSTAADGRSVFSNFNVPSVFTTAPGEALITSFPGNTYAAVWGTSFSTALVTGAAAILAEMNPSGGYSGAVDPLENGHQISSSLGLDDSRLDVYATLQTASGGN
jgi:hypothetical protein